MRFRTVQDILDWTRTYHHHLAEGYRQLSGSSSRERARMLLDYLADHQEKLERGIREYETDAADKLLRTWFQDVRETPLPESLDKADQTLRDADTPQIMYMAMEFHDVLIRLYTDLARQAPTGDLRQLFTGLADMENHEKMRMVRDAMRFEDL